MEVELGRQDGTLLGGGCNALCFDREKHFCQNPENSPLEVCISLFVNLPQKRKAVNE